MMAAGLPFYKVKNKLFFIMHSGTIGVTWTIGVINIHAGVYF